MLSNLRAICLGMTLIVLTSFNLAHAAPAGTVQTDFGGRESITGTVLQPDGKLVAVGYFYGGGSNSFALARYGSDGKLDTTFGTGGKVLTTNFGASSGYAGQAEAKAVALQVDGKIVVAGDTYTNDIGLARYNPDGSLDTTFGSGGKVVTDWGAASELAFAVGIQSNGKIIVGGYTDTKGTFDFVMSRYNSDGSIDTSFGTNGIVYTDFTASDDRIEALKVIAGDKIVAVGRSDYNIAVAQYTAAGVLDAQFGSGGKVTTDLGGYYWEMARAVAIDANRKIVVAGQGGPNGDVAVLRYTTSGSLDGKFGSGGKVLTNLGGTNDQAAAIGINLSTGKISVAGYVGNGSGFEVLRYNSNGNLDSTFGSGGRVSTRIGSNSYEQAVALVIQGNGQIIAGGNAGSSTTQDNFALARYNASNGSLDSSYGAKANLAITVTSSPNPVQLGSTITHTITVTNNGPDAAEQVMISGASSPLATLASGATTTLIQTATVEVGGSLIFTATVDSITADPDSANNSATSTTPVNGAADLSLTMTANPMLAKLYKPLTYTVTVTNNGPDPAMKVVSTHTAPSGSGYVWFSSVSTTQGTCVYNYYSGISCDIGTMSSGSVVTITLVYTPQANGALTNTASVTGVGDPNTTNNSATVNSTIYTATDLAVTATDSADPVKFGNQVTYTITVKNNGPDAADNVPLWNGVFYQNLPYYQPDITLLSINSAQGTCTLEPPLPPNTWGAALASCSFPRIESGASATVTLVATSNATGVLELISRLAGSYYSPDSYPIYLDPDLGNNTAIEHTTITGAADLVMTVTPSKSSVVPGENLTYNITVTNNGVDPALRTDVSDFMPIGMGFVSISSGQGTCSGETLTTHPYYGGIAGCSFGTLNAGASVSITLVVQAFMTGTVSNAFYAISNITDPTPADANRTINTTVTGATDMAISMTDSPDPVRVNNEVTYSIVVTNNGPYPSMATVSDLLPSGTYIRGYVPSQGGCDNTVSTEVICKLGIINSGASATISIQVMTTARGNITNRASVASSVTDSNTANNSASVVTSVSR